MNYHALQFNGSGTTIKDIGAYETIEHAVSQGANVIVNVTSGNNGAALKRAVLDYNHRKPLEEKVKVVHIISSNRRIVGSLGDSDENGFWYSIPYVSEDLDRKWLTKDEREAIARDFAGKNKKDGFKVEEAIDVTHFVPDGNIRRAQDILQQQIDGRYLDCIGIPVGTGKTYAAFYTALKNLLSRGIPIDTKLVGLLPKGENPIYSTFVFERNIDGTLEHVIEGFNPSSPADKLSCPGTDLRPLLLQAITEGHPFVQIDEKTVRKANEFSHWAGRKYGATQLTLEDSGSVGFALADNYIAKLAGIKKGDKVGIFITGMGLYATPSWELARIERKIRWESIKDISIRTLSAAALTGILFVPIYMQNRVPLEERERTTKSNQIYEQKRILIKQISGYDTSMAKAADNVRRESRYLHSLDSEGKLIVPGDELDKIILRYLEFNKDKIQNARDPRDIATLEALRALVIQSEQLKQQQKN